MPALEAPRPALTLSQACAALWRATLSLMVAFMKTAAPAHRYLIARRIARNLDLLGGQDCFNTDCRATFSQLARRWNRKADRLTSSAGAHPNRPPFRLLS